MPHIVLFSLRLGRGTECVHRAGGLFWLADVVNAELSPNRVGQNSGAVFHYLSRQRENFPAENSLEQSAVNGLPRLRRHVDVVPIFHAIHGSGKRQWSQRGARRRLVKGMLV